jgi:hypothetical protein
MRRGKPDFIRLVKAHKTGLYKLRGGWYGPERNRWGHFPCDLHDSLVRFENKDVAILIKKKVLGGLPLDWEDAPLK